MFGLSSVAGVDPLAYSISRLQTVQFIAAEDMILYSKTHLYNCTVSTKKIDKLEDQVAKLKVEITKIRGKK